MATIKKREGTRGTTYLIRVSCGYAADGSQVTRSMTWKPSPGMTSKQIDKELQRQAVLFEEQCAGNGASGAVKFETFARQWFSEYADIKLRSTTVARLHRHETRTYSAIGHIRLDKLTSRHIQSFINNLGEPGINNTAARYAPKIKLPESMTQKQLSDISGVSRTTISSMLRGNCVTEATAKKIAKAMNTDINASFSVEIPRQGLSPKTIRNYLSIVSSILGYAARMGMIQHNPALNVTTPPLDAKEKQIFTIDEAQAFLDSLRAAPSKYRAFCVLAIYGGFRRGEILGLEWSDIDFTNNVVSIRRTSLYLKERGTFTDTTKTTKSQRSLKLPSSVLFELKLHRAEQSRERLTMGDRWTDSNRLFVDSEGKPMHPNTPYFWLRRFCKETGQRFLGVHHFRHLNASLLINSGADARTVAASLGHSQTSTTLNIYAHTFEEAQARAGEAVAAALEQNVSLKRA